MRLLLTLWILTVSNAVCADGIHLTDYHTLKAEFDGFVDFEEIHAPSFPGQSVDFVRRYKGLAVGTHLGGQISYRSGSGDLAAARLTGLPHSKPRVANHSSRYTDLVFLRLFKDLPFETVVATTRAYDPGTSSLNAQYNLGRGSIALGLSNRQLALGLRLVFFGSDASAYKSAVFNFYDIDGQPINNEPVVIQSSGYYGFATRSGSREIYGVTIVVSGHSNVAVDEIVFELPIFIGRANHAISTIDEG